MKKFFWEAWEFIKLVHSGSDLASSKRFYGGIITMAVLTLLYLFASKLFPPDMWTAMEDAIMAIFYVAAGLLGIGTVLEGYKTYSEVKKNKLDKKSDNNLDNKTDKGNGLPA